ncbi:heparinase II/III family protein [Catalinimonas sp. 4WD22]|uniref:heparinase II/III domain-containing protein n=1 Tax=Catalinimonas locisalis TaxID=3133978 RepID=UPI003101029E
MKYSLLPLLFFFSAFSHQLSAQQSAERLISHNFLSESFSSVQLPDLLIPVSEWHPFPTSSERQAWDSLDEKIRSSYIKKAEEALQGEWKDLPATVFLEFARNGNRSNFQELRSSRREMLLHLVLGECFEGKGRFTEAIINAVWSICEESYWGVPAHLYLQEAGPGLPDVEEPTIDLFAAETAALLAWTEYLLGEQLDEVSPLILKRISYEFDKRIFEPFEMRDDFWWMGFARDRHVNNWNPWINSNILTASLLHLDDQKRKSAIVHKSLRSLDNFLNHYPEDGGCDEGPSYWNRAAGSLFDCLEILYGASGNQIDVYDEALIQKMGSYIYKTYIDDDYFVNFADAAAVNTIQEDLVFRYGDRIGDSNMKALGASKAMQRNIEEDLPTDGRSLGRHLYAIFNWEDIAQYPVTETPYVADAWFPDLQVMTARSEQGTPQGLFLAAQGGHNDESHNHNDVGNFIVYVDGQPAIIDVGVEEYTAKTFSPQRYEIWTMQSAFHNVPTINGMMQLPGRKYEAQDVKYVQDVQEINFSLDISKAYPVEAAINHWKRNIQFDRDTWVQISDDYELEELNGELHYTLMTAFNVEKVEAGKIKLVYREGMSNAEAFIFFDANKFDLETEKIAITDTKLLKSWPGTIHRLLFTAKNPKKKDQWRFTIAKDEEVGKYL